MNICSTYWKSLYKHHICPGKSYNQGAVPAVLLVIDRSQADHLPQQKMKDGSRRIPAYFGRYFKLSIVSTAPAAIAASAAQKSA